MEVDHTYEIMCCVRGGMVGHVCQQTEAQFKGKGERKTDELGSIPDWLSIRPDSSVFVYIKADWERDTYSGVKTAFPL